MAILQSKTPCIPSTLKSRNGRGYAIKTKMVNGKQKWYLYHRYVWEQHYGPIPKGKVIRHLCHNPECINIEHLAIGTQKDNARDGIDAGHLITNQKLTTVQAREILDSKGTISAKELAPKYNISAHTVRDIWARRHWKHLTE